MNALKKHYIPTSLALLVSPLVFVVTGVSGLLPSSPDWMYMIVYALFFIGAITYFIGSYNKSKSFPVSFFVTILLTGVFAGAAYAALLIVAFSYI